MFEKTEQGTIAHPPVTGGELNAIGYACEVMKRFKPKLTVVYLSSVDSCHSNFTSYLSLNSSVGGFKVRNRKAGDKFQPTGMTGTKKLKDFMIDNKIDKHLRNNIPLVIGNQGIAWVVGWRLSEWAKPLTNDKSVIKLEFGLR